MRNMHHEALDLGHLRLLEAIGRTGSVSRAAGEIGLSQPAASHALARMRRLLDDELFVRTPQGMVATWYGKKLGGTLTESLRALRDALASEKEFDPATSQRVFHVYLSDGGQLVLLPGLLSHLRHHAPGVRLHVERFPRLERGRAMALGDVDLAIGHIEGLVAGFRQRTLFMERYVTVASDDNPRFAAGMNLELFTASPHAIADSSGMAHWVVDEALARKGIQRRLGLVVPDYMTLPFVMAGSELIATMPGRLAERFARIAPLRVMPTPVPIEPYPIRMFWHERSHQDPANVWLRRTMTQLFPRGQGHERLRGG
jgi:molybdate transport repressor ModE-like protein